MVHYKQRKVALPSFNKPACNVFTLPSLFCHNARLWKSPLACLSFPAFCGQMAARRAAICPQKAGEKRSDEQSPS